MVLKKLKKITSFILSLLIPRTSKVAVFGERSGNRFAEDARYLYLYLSLNSEINCVWLTKNDKVYELLRSRGLNCEMSHSFKGMYYGFRANWHIFNYSKSDTSEFTSIGANHLNVWTGIQLKKLRTFKNYNKIYNKFAFLYRKIFSKKKLFLYPDKKNFSWISDHYYKDDYKILNLNFPKNILYDEIFRENNRHEYLLDNEISEIDKLKNIKGKVIGYFPTWRDKPGDFFIDLSNYEKLNMINEILEKNNSIILMKYHATTIEKDREILSKFEKFNNFRILRYDFDLNPILKYCDILISDYSGIITDFLITNKPIILYIPDLKDYSIHPGLNLDYDNFEIGHKANTFDELLHLIKLYLSNEKEFSDKFLVERKKYFDIFYEKKDLGLEKIHQIISS
tara:strand:- start:102 stop:1289 length:1188 start_codon:yes stop_codon:yes gene_type:complete